LDTVPKIVGIDEWAIWKGHTYATIIVYLERRRPIELLADAELATVEAWFKAHPEVKIISRDRDTVFAEAGRKGAPQAVQVADRWHLLKNLGDAVKRTLDLNQAALRAAAGAIAGFGNGRTDTPTQATTTAQSAPPEVSLPSRPRGGRPKKETVTKSNLRLKEVKELQAQCYSIREMGKHLKMHRQTVKKYLHLEKVPKKQYPPGFGGKSSW
jgi:transposase